jgi:hypothetical protein
MKKIAFLLIAFIPVCLYAQINIWNNPVIQKDCDARIFDKVEILPSLKIAKEDFEDSLSLYLKTKKAFSKNTTIRFRFIVASHSQILGVIKDSGNARKEDVLKKAITDLSSLWLPARQNSYPICAYVHFEIEFLEDKLRIDIVP